MGTKNRAVPNSVFLSGTAIASSEMGSRVIQNPWLQLPKQSPFVLECDRLFIEEHNNCSNDRKRVDIKLLPEPFMGMPSAEIILLNLNPGRNKNDIKYHHQATFQGLNAHNLHHKRAIYPFYLLNPDLKDCPGYKWWGKKLGHLIKKFDRRRVSQKICCIEFFPYHSKRYGFPDSNRLPSQEYSFYLVRKAIKREAVIVIMRSQNRWEAAVPELQGYYNKVIVNSVQNPCLTPNNLSSEAYEKIAAVLSQ